MIRVMHEWMAEPVQLEVADWRLTASSSVPAIIDIYRQHALLHEDFGVPSGADAVGYFFAAISRGAEAWPGLVVTQEFSPTGGGFSPGVLVVPETEVVFFGAGSRLLCYQHQSIGWARLWQDTAGIGFWGWQRHGDVVLLSAEIELAAWTIAGSKLWTTFVEPNWSFEVSDDTVRLDVMGTVSSFPLELGPDG